MNFEEITLQDFLEMRERDIEEKLYELEVTKDLVEELIEQAEIVSDYVASEFQHRANQEDSDT